MAKLADFYNRSSGYGSSTVCDDKRWCKLVDVRFPRRPPTFGIVYLSQSAGATTSRSQQEQSQPVKKQHQQSPSINLAILKLIGTNSKEAKFIDRAQIGFSHVLHSTIITDMDVVNELLIDENDAATVNDNNNHIDNPLQCILLGHNGSLFSVHLTAETTVNTTINNNTNNLTGNCDANNGQQFVVELRNNLNGLPIQAPNYSHSSAAIQCCLRTGLSSENMSSTTAAAETKASTTKVETQATSIPKNTSFIHVLSGTTYTSYTLLPNNRVMINKDESYDLSDRQLRHHTSNLRFVRMLVVDSENDGTTREGSSKSIVLIELSDQRLQVVERGNCLHVIRFDEPFLNRCIVLKAHSMDPTTSTGIDLTLISMHDTKIFGYSLQTSLRNLNVGERSSAALKKANGRDGIIDFDDEHDVWTGKSARAESNLLEPEPSFEFEMCWSIDLNDIDSIRALSFDTNLSKSEETDFLSSSRSNGCLCPIWSPGQLLAHSSDESSDESQLGWPKFLLIAYKFHLLLYSFEQTPQLPFSLVYDRAFINELSLDAAANKHPHLTDGASAANLLKQECIDLKARPKLLHNFKLVGADYPTDSLFNNLFLANRIHLTQMRQFPLMGTILTISNCGHVLVFKLRSSKVTMSHKDNVYQQLVIDSLRESSFLLMDEIKRVEAGNQLLRVDIESLERSLNLIVGRNKLLAASTTVADNLDRMLGAKFVPRQTMAALYDLRITLSSLIKIRRLIVFSTANCMILEPISSLFTGSNESTTNFNTRSDSCTIESYHLNNNVGKTNSRTFVLAHMLAAEPLDVEAKNQLIMGGSTEDDSIKSYAIIELMASGPQNSLVIVPIFLMDSRQFGGKIGVHYIMEGATKEFDGSNDSQSDLISSITQHIMHQQSTTAKYHTKSIGVRPLESYCLVDDRLTSHVRISSTITVRLKASISAVDWISWLSECVCLSTPNDAEADCYLKLRSGRLESFFTHCIIEFSILEKEKQSSMVELSSDDFKAIELCKKHFLSCATDRCIEMQIVEHTPIDLDHLRHIIASQYSNINRARHILASNQEMPNTSGFERSENHDMLMNIMNESNLNELAPQFLRPDLLDQLEKSLKQDLTQKNLGSDDDNYRQPSSTINNDGRTVLASTLIDISIGFLIDTLIEFDNLQGRRPTTTTITAMRSKLDLRCKTGPLSPMIQFVDQIIDDWHR